MANYSKPKHDLKGTYSSITTRPEEADQQVLEASWCGCFGLRRRHKYNNQETRVFLKQNYEGNGRMICKESWLVSELKEFSEGGSRNCNWRRSKGKIQCVYSPESYALNFDDGGDDGCQREEEEGFISFRSRSSRPM